MSVRKVVTRSGGHSRGLMPSTKNQTAAAWESQHELRFYQLLELSPSVQRYTVQPTREQIVVDGEPAAYIPDVEVVFVNGLTVFFEIKPSSKCRTARVAARLQAIRKHFSDTARNFVLITDDWLAQEPRQSNVTCLMYHRRPLLLSQHERTKLLSQLTRNHPKNIEDLESLIGRNKAWLLFGLGIVGIDLEQPIGQHSEIFLEGGHRHAHLHA